MVESGQSPVVDEQRLCERDRKAEAVFLGLRLMRGVDTRAYQKTFGTDIYDEHADDFRLFQEAGLIEFDGDSVRLTRAGALMSNEVFARFV